MRTIVVLALVALLVGTSYAWDPEVFFRKVIYGYFSEFQSNVNDTAGCYYMIGSIYENIVAVIAKFQSFSMSDLPKIVAAITDVIYRCIDLDTPCQFVKTVEEISNVAQNMTILESRFDILSLLTILNNLQKGILTSDYATLGRAIGFSMRKLVNFQI